jgi:hypothetical protein
MRALLLVVACASSAPKQMMMTSSDMAGATSMSDMATQNGMSDKQFCDSACATLIGCGVEFGSGCSTGCQASNVFLPCIKAADVSDCNAMSFCSFKQYSADVCGGNGGVPNGSNSCKDTATCETNCNISAPGVASCPCNCIAGLLPTKASALLINNQCALAKCPTECGATGSSAACNTCAAQMCVAEHAQCANQ